MTKQELIDKIADDLDIGKAQVASVLDALGDVAAYELAGGGEVSLPGLGKLVVTPTAARKGRNPKTGQSLDIPAGHRVAFRPYKALKEALK